MMSAKLSTSSLLKKTACSEKNLWYQPLTDQSSYILLVKYVPFCHTTEGDIKNIHFEILP